MASPQQDRDAWLSAGGDPERLGVFELAGRVVPFSDGDARCLAGIHPLAPDVGAVWDWVGDARVLLEAERWLAEQGCRVARGPFALSTWFPVRANLGPYEEPPFALEPTDRAGRWEEAGYTLRATWMSVIADREKHVEGAMEVAGSLSAAGWSLRPLTTDPQPSEGTLREAVSVIHQITSAAGADVFGFEPVPEEAMQRWYASLRTRIDPRLVLFAHGPDGAPAGYVFGMPDFALQSRRWMLVPSLAVRPEFQKNGLGQWLIGAVHRAGAKAGYAAGVHCWVWSGFRVEAPSPRGGKLFRRYGLLEKPLEAGR